MEMQKGEYSDFHVFVKFETWNISYIPYIQNISRQNRFEKISRKNKDFSCKTGEALNSSKGMFFTSKTIQNQSQNIGNGVPSIE